MQKLVGFKNPNNVCYANAVLQLLWNTEFMKKIDEYYDLIESSLDEFNDKYPIKKNKQIVGMELLRSILIVRHKFNKSEHDVDICEFNLINFRSVIQKEFWSGRGGQQDAHEFLNNLINYIQIALEHLGSKIVQDEFGAKLISYIRGEDCKHESYKKIDYDYYELFVKPERDGDTLQSLIDSTFNNVTVLTGDSAWACEECGEKKTAIKTPSRIYNYPKNLMVCIQRFKFDRFGSKIKTTVSIDNIISIAILDEDDTIVKYQLCGFVTHLGFTLAGGHYIAVIKDEDKWLVCNDSLVYRKNTLEEAKTSAGGDIYLLMYRIIE